ncbi:unnamed protein product [Peronospora farinosa]|uniref:C2 domain-containing protein n=1 Tax=Peronospora farinosa TaxID=134698 RepID=A0AAV0UV11_9STRA|nr:unnamed protein product [Peronospora farinosa]CAI5740292.1 unnamed protein product [Peronospora farinosa]
MPLPQSSSNNKSTDLYEWPTRPTSPAHDMDNDCACGLNDDKPYIEQLLVKHLRFAHAFRKNDAAMILQFLAKDVTLISVDGARHEGQSAVLAYLVGACMTKISSNLRVKGCPTRSGTCQSTFIYEHGVVFKDPLYMEMLDWKPHSATVVRIVHAAIPDAKSGKTSHDFCKSSPLRLSFGTRSSGDEDLSEISGESDGSATKESENHNANAAAPVKARYRRKKPKSSADRCSAAMSAVTAASLRLSSSSSSQSGVNEADMESVPSPGGSMKSMSVIKLAEISCIGLTPIRKRKTVNPFVIVRCPKTGAVWKSPVKRRDSNPKWNHIPLRIHAHKLAKVVEISLWDHTFFHSVKVAGVVLVGSDLLKGDAEFSTNIQLERLDGARAAGEAQYVTMQLRFLRPSGGSIAVTADEVVRDPAQNDNNENELSVAPRSALIASLKWLLVDPFMDGHHASVLLMLVRAAIVAVIVWNVYHVTFVWPKQV